MKLKPSHSLLAVVLAMSSAGCSSSHVTAIVKVQPRPGADSSKIDQLETKVTSSGGRLLEVGTFHVFNLPWEVDMHSIATGTDQTFTTRFLDSANHQLYVGQATGVTLSSGEKTLVFITLDDPAAPSTDQSEAPYVASLSAYPSEVSAGGTVTLHATAHDRNPGDTLHVDWKATGGTLSAPSGDTITWTAPSTGTDYSVDCTVTDSQGLSSSITVPLTVLAASAM